MLGFISVVLYFEDRFIPASAKTATDEENRSWRGSTFHNIMMIFRILQIF
jgi:hypothetical protein